MDDSCPPKDPLEDNAMLSSFSVFVDHLTLLVDESNWTLLFEHLSMRKLGKSSTQIKVQRKGGKDLSMHKPGAP